VATPGVHSEVEPRRVLQAAEIRLDRAAHLVWVKQTPVFLTLLEFRLLETLLENADHLLASAELLESIWGPAFSGDPGTLAVYILRLRKKIERRPRAPHHIRTVRGIGYVFDTTPV
jgi:DNA-binding response OmpR family regulator